MLKNLNISSQSSNKLTHSIFPKLFSTINKVIGLGSPVIDLITQVDITDITNNNLQFGQTLFYNESNKGFAELIQNKNLLYYHAGGSIMNSIRVCSWMLQNYQEKHCSMLGSIGQDSNGQQLKLCLEQNRVKYIFEELEDYQTSTCYIGIYKKERTMLTRIEASKYLTNEFIREKFNDIIDNDVLVIEGYFLRDNADIVIQMMKSFNEKKKKVILTLSAQSIIECCFDNLLNVCSYSDIIFCNKDEARAFARKLGEIEEVDEHSDSAISDEECDKKSASNDENVCNNNTEINILKHIKNHDNKDIVLVVTNGKKPVSIARKDQDGNIEYLGYVSVPKIATEKIVDTDGCGDAFLGGFLSQYMLNKDYLDCIKAANWAASIVLQHTGCDYPIDLKYPN